MQCSKVIVGSSGVNSSRRSLSYSALSSGSISRRFAPTNSSRLMPNPAARSPSRRSRHPSSQLGNLLERLGHIRLADHPEDLQRAFFSTRYVRVLDPLGYAGLIHWRVYGAEALAKREAALWLDEENLTVEHQGETLSRYEIAFQIETGLLTEVSKPQLFETAHRSPQPRLFDLSGILWLRALRANDHASRRPQRPQGLQREFFPHAQAL